MFADSTTTAVPLDLNVWYVMAQSLEIPAWCWNSQGKFLWSNALFQENHLNQVETERLWQGISQGSPHKIRVFLRDEAGIPHAHDVAMRCIASAPADASTNRWLLIAYPVLYRNHPFEVLNHHLISTLREKNGLVAELQRTTSQLTSIIAVQSQLVQVELDLDRFAHLVIERLCELTSAHSAAIMLLENQTLNTIASCGLETTALQFPLTGTLAEHCLHSGQLVFSSNVDLDFRVQRHWLPTDAGSLLMAPVFHSGKAVGVVRLTSARHQLFSTHDQQTLLLMAGMLGSALAHQQDFELSSRLIDQRTHALHELQQEIQRREQTEQILMRTMERTQAILETSHEGFLSFDAQLNITGLNAEAALMLGADKAALMGASLGHQILQDPFLSRLRLGITQFRKHGRWPWLKRRMELTLQRRHGLSFVAEVSFSATGSQEQPEFHAFLHDITHRKRAEELLMQQQQMLRSITDNLPAVVAYLDMEGRYRYVNEHARRLLTTGNTSLEGQPALQLLGPSAPKPISLCLQQAQEEGLSRTEASLPTQAGSRRFEFRCIAQRNLDGVVEGFHLIAWDIEERWQEELRLREAATRDTLTGALNRQGFLQELDTALNLHPAPRHALLYLDLDTFKMINDVHGHFMGDEVLQVFTGRLRMCVREGDAIGRIGGDEFLVLLRHVEHLRTAERIANDILSAMREPWSIQGTNLTMTTSIGLTLHRQNESAPDLIARADEALYQAKAAGRNTFCRL